MYFSLLIMSFDFEFLSLALWMGYYFDWLSIKVVFLTFLSDTEFVNQGAVMYEVVHWSGCALLSVQVRLSFQLNL